MNDLKTNFVKGYKPMNPFKTFWRAVLLVKFLSENTLIHATRDIGIFYRSVSKILIEYIIRQYKLIKIQSQIKK